MARSRRDAAQSTAAALLATLALELADRQAIEAEPGSDLVQQDIDPDVDEAQNFAMLLDMLEKRIRKTWDD